MIKLEIEKEQFIDEFNLHLNSGSSPQAALEQAFITVGKEYLLQVEKLELIGFPLASFAVRGKYRDKIFAVRQGTQYIKQYRKPNNPQTFPQQANRDQWKEIGKNWMLLSDSEKAVYNLRAEGKPFSGFNLYVQEQYRNGNSVR